MKDFGFKIKVSDLLLNVWTEDEIKFENKHTTKISNLSQQGISGHVVIKWLDEKTILVTIKDISAKLHEICDISWQDFLRQANVQSYDMKFLLLQDDEIAQNYDDVGFIDQRDMTIDIQDMLVQAIILNKPIVMRAPEVEKFRSDTENKKLWKEDSSEEIPYNTVNWIYK